jgi:hypothetical protein
MVYRRNADSKGGAEVPVPLTLLFDNRNRRTGTAMEYTLKVVSNTAMNGRKPGPYYQPGRVFAVSATPTPDPSDQRICHWIVQSTINTLDAGGSTFNSPTGTPTKKPCHSASFAALRAACLLQCNIRLPGVV